ncbi:sulfatase [Blautia hominis]|uniref:Sulfatase n=1 Tax=Blautia hominis TaxID=2025493 RepID=A0ABQ0BDF0_9FIRM
MKAIMVMYDSLNRNMLEPYGCVWISTPNFKRLAECCVTFDCNYAGSLPCMPARRELHTGRYNFEHRSWGPIEPFDDSMPEILKNHGVYTHLATDHDHYWEDGGATYHSRYSSFEFSRGQEGDHWKVNRELIRATNEHRLVGQTNYYDQANREYMDCEEKMSQAVTFSAGLDFLEKSHEEDNWFLQIETFDPHEPFYTQEAWKKQFAHEYNGLMKDWPPYYFVTEGEESVNHMRMEYASLITMCDHYLGKVLDKMDEYNLWEDTMLIVNTDHGYLLGEHGWWSKSVMPVYDEICHTPLFVYDPRSKVTNERRSELVQTIDLAPTLLEYFGVEIPEHVEGKTLRCVIENHEKIREYALFGYHEGHCNITDGNYVYMKAPLHGTANYEYTMMPTHMAQRFWVDELQDVQLQEPFSFTKGCRTMKIQAKEGMNHMANFGTKLFCLADDPNQEHPLENIEKETELLNAMLKLMRKNECPKERYARFGLPEEGTVTEEDVERLHEREVSDYIPERIKDLRWERGAMNMYLVMRKFLQAGMNPLEEKLRKMIGSETVTVNHMLQLIESEIPAEQQPMIYYFAMLASRTI